MTLRLALLLAALILASTTRPCLADDYGDTCDTAFLLPNQSTGFSGVIDSLEDQDWISIQTTPGHLYVLRFVPGVGFVVPTVTTYAPRCGVRLG